MKTIAYRVAPYCISDNDYAFSEIKSKQFNHYAGVASNGRCPDLYSGRSGVQFLSPEHKGIWNGKKNYPVIKL